MGKNIKVICLLLLDIILIFCGCSEKKNSLQPQPTSLYACNDYTMRIRGDGTVEYLYQRDGFAEAVSAKKAGGSRMGGGGADGKVFNIGGSTGI